VSDIPIGGAGVPLATGHLEAHRVLAERARTPPFTWELSANVTLGAPTLIAQLPVLPGAYGVSAGVLVVNRSAVNSHAVEIWIQLTGTGNSILGPRAAQLRLPPEAEWPLSLGPCWASLPSGGNLILMAWRADAGDVVEALARTSYGQNQPGATAMVAL
jgi:hypothetical protein